MNNKTKKALMFFTEQSAKKYIPEEVVNKSNQPMSRGDIGKRDRLASKIEGHEGYKGDTKEENRYRLATYITLSGKVSSKKEKKEKKKEKK